MYITNHYLVAIHNALCSVLVRFCVFTCCEPPRCLQVRCRLTCSNRSPNRFISSRFAVAGARSFVPTMYPPPKRRPKNIRTHFLPAPLLRKANDDFHARAAASRYTWAVETCTAPNIRNVLLLLLWLFVM